MIHTQPVAGSKGYSLPCKIKLSDTFYRYIYFKQRFFKYLRGIFLLTSMRALVALRHYKYMMIMTMNILVAHSSVCTNS